MSNPRTIAPDGTVRQTYLLSQIDSASRYLPHSYFARNEGDSDQEHGNHGARAHFELRDSAYCE